MRRFCSSSLKIEKMEERKLPRINKTFLIGKEKHGERLDKFLSESLSSTFQSNVTRSFISNHLLNKNLKSTEEDLGTIFLNERNIVLVKSGLKLKEKDVIKFSNLSPNFIQTPSNENDPLVPENIPLDIIFADEDIAVINKPYGMMVHSSPGHTKGTLANSLLYHFSNLSTLGGNSRPGIVHRLDRDTSGLIVIAKNNQAHEFLKEHFSSHKIIKKYTAIVVGNPPDNGENLIDKPIARHPQDINKMIVSVDGKPSQTKYSVIKTFQTPTKEVFSLLNIQILTGRTHQIRVHFSHLGFPLVGDSIYNKKKSKFSSNENLMLASTFLQLTHPSNGKTLQFQIPYPFHIKGFLEKLEILNK